MISNIVPRGNRKIKKVEAVNKLLFNICKQKEIPLVGLPLVSHGNVSTKIHLNKSRQYLNAHGKSVFAKNLRNFFKNFN